MDSLDNPKLKKLLSKLLDPKFKVKNETYLNGLLDHIKDSQARDCPIINQDSFIVWLKQALEQWEKQKTQPAMHILTFTLNLSVIYSTEDTFVKLNRENIFERLISFVKTSLNEPRTSLGVKLAYIKLLSSLLNHKTGIHFVLSTNYWSQVIDFILNSDTIYIRKEGCKFIAVLLQKSTNINEWFCYSVIQTLSAPLVSAVQRKDIEEQEVNKDLSPTFFLMNQVCANLLEICGPKNDGKVFKIILEKFAFEKQIRHLQSKVQDEDIIFQLHKILFTLAFFDFVLRLGGRNQDIHMQEAAVASQKLFDVFLDVANRGPVANFLKLLYVGLVYWQYIKPIMPLCKTPESIPVTFETQLLSLQLFPLVVVHKRFLGNHSFEDLDDYVDVKEQFLDEMMKYITPDTFRTTLKWKGYLQRNFSFDHVTLALKYVLHSRKFYTRDTAKMAFQIMIHNIHDITMLFQKQPQQLVVFSRDNNYLCLLLETLTTIINDFSITWKDCLESICVLDITFKLLSYPVWSSKLVVRGLKLMEIAISKYMSPNMALLVDNTNDTVNIMGPILYSKTHDVDWEVRDSVLEIIKTISRLAKKFPSLRRTILEADFPSITLKIAKGDMEPYVRAGAYKCLQEMVEINELWSDLLKNDVDVIDYFIQSLHQESEGIVRKEIATLISVIYEYQDLPEHVIPRLYDIMTHAVMVDLHWEVKVKALNFWQKVLERHLMDQGVIDGTFPKITFSKEHRKIVTLNEIEIKRRLVKVLNLLSETGCLAVFIAALQDDCDVEVSKAAVNLIKNFVEMLKQHKVSPGDLISNDSGSPVRRSPKGYVSPQSSHFSAHNSYNSPRNSPQSFTTTHSVDSQYSSASSFSTISDHSPFANQDAIIDQILDAQDMKLLESVFNNANVEVQNSVEVKKKTVCNPINFLEFVFSNFQEQTTQKAQWIQDIDNLNSFLDDILCEYEPSDVNNMDCY